MAVASILEQAQYGGYDFTFTKPFPDRFNCSICTKVLRDPQLTGCCGQHFCESCLKHWFKKQKTTCPHCRQENFNHMLNKALKRDIDDLEIRCTKQGLGCQWVGELSSLQTHLDSDKGCGYVEVQCSNKCGAKMKRKELKAHLERQCPLRRIHCQYCHYEDTYKCSTTGIRRADMDNHCSRCELEPVECPFREAGCKVHVVRKEFDSHMTGNQQNHLLVLLGAFQETKRELVESRRERDESRKELDECQRKLIKNQRELDESRRELDESRRELDKSETILHNTNLLLLQTREELEESRSTPAKQMTLKEDGDELIFCMYGYSLYKHTGKVWHSPPFYYGDGYKLCLAVYANGKGAGAGTHVSVLMQMKGEHDDKLRWNEGQGYSYCGFYRIYIKLMAQSEKAQAPEKVVSLSVCTNCFVRQPPPEDLRVFKTCYGNAVSGDKFIDHQSAEQMMVLNDTIALRIRYIYTPCPPLPPHSPSPPKKK